MVKTFFFHLANLLAPVDPTSIAPSPATITTAGTIPALAPWALDEIDAAIIAL